MEDKDFENAKEDIKEAYRLMESIVKMNPQLYIMPESIYNKIVKKIIGLERALNNARNSRDNWKNKFTELNKIKKS